MEITIDKEIHIEPIYQEGSYDITRDSLESDIKDHITKRTESWNHVRILLLEDWKLSDSNLEKLPSRIDLGTEDISPDYVEDYIDEEIDIRDNIDDIIEEIISHLRQSDDKSTKRLLKIYDGVIQMSWS